ncbi:unnamed protein product [Rotaria sp. Silwood2]|nr:unnamed protein product [Rotaria sp. Silwood2]
MNGNLIGMYTLSPPLFQLLVKHLQLTNSRLARQYPAVHYGTLKTLYSHCAALIIFIRRMYVTTWLECLFQSCQRKSNNESSNEEQLSESQHRLLSYEQLLNFGNDALLGFI